MKNVKEVNKGTSVLELVRHCEKCLKENVQLHTYSIEWGFSSQDESAYILCKPCAILIDKSIEIVNKKRR